VIRLNSLAARRSWLCLGGMLMCGAISSPLWGQKVPVVERALPNGMTMLLVERHDDPSIAAGWVAHVMEQRGSPALLRPRARYVGPVVA